MTNDIPIPPNKISSFKQRKECEKCKREYSLPNFDRHFKACDGSGPQQHTDINVVKNTIASCPNCKKDFRNVYSMSAHKAHCLGLNDTKHLDGKRAWNKGKINSNLEQIFSNDERNTRGDTWQVKKLFIQLGYHQTYACALCKLSEWCGNKITLELDHINGNYKDNRIENLRLLCPNCHSQTPTFCGRKRS